MPASLRHRKREKCRFQSTLAFPPHETHLAAAREVAKRRLIQEALPKRGRIPVQPAGGIRGLACAISDLERLEADQSSAKPVEVDPEKVLLLKLRRLDLIQPYWIGLWCRLFTMDVGRPYFV
jgi:hypothetical protein